MNQMINTFHIIWTVIGSILGIIFAYSHNISTSLVLRSKRPLIPASLFFISTLRIILISIVLFFALRVDFIYGILCLSSFIVFRWIGLIIFNKKSPIHIQEGNY